MCAAVPRAVRATAACTVTGERGRRGRVGFGHCAGAGRCRGYALVVALILVLAASLAAGLAMQRAQTEGRRERERELLFAGGQLREAIARYYAVAPAGGKPQYPAALTDLLSDRRFPFAMRHLRRLYPDPMTGQPDWDLVLADGRIVGVRSRSGAAPLRRAGFDTGEEGFAGAASYRDWVFAAAAVAAAPAQPVASPPADGPPPPPPQPHQNERLYCYNTYAVPQSHCTDEPPPTGDSVEACMAFYGGAYNQCMAAIPGP